MSCALNTLASIRNINGILEWFQFDGELPEQDLMDWNAKWEDWDSSNIEKQSKKWEEWLGKCISSLSSMGDVATIAHKNRIVILAANDIHENEDIQILSVTWKGTVGAVDDDEITDVMCLPLASQNTSSAGTPDWTCIIIGFKSGYVNVYSENGIVLFSQMYEEKPVIKLHCRTFTLGDFGIPLYTDKSSEFVIAYPNCVVSINGTHFLEILRLCRKRSAKVSAGSLKLEDLPPLKYKKYGLAEQECLTSCVSAGSLVLRLYEKLIQESSSKGFVNHVSARIVSKGHLITVGEIPYFGIIEMTDESTPVYFRDVAYGFASKLKNSVISAATDWFFPLKGSTTEEPSKPKIEPASPAAFRTFLPDRRRVGTSVALSPSRRLAAVTDSFGRVVVIDVVRGIAVKMWKGYRDAECGWQEVVDEWGGEKRKVSFLIIYAPRRGLLEVWLPQQGSRIAAFNVSKQARLLYAHHIVLGYASDVCETYHSYPVLLFNPSGIVERIHIPFHLALSSKTDRQARDQHLLKEIRIYIKNKDDDSAISLIKELDTVYGKLQFIIHLMNAKKYSIFLLENAIEILRGAEDKRQEKIGDDEEKIADDEEKKIGNDEEEKIGDDKEVEKVIEVEQTVRIKKTEKENDYELNKLNKSLKTIEKLLVFYKYLTTDSENKTAILMDLNKTKKMFGKMLMINVDEVDSISIISQSDAKQSSVKKVKFEMDSSERFNSYMNSFQDIAREENHATPSQVDINNSAHDRLKIELTNLMLSKCEIGSIVKFLNAVNESGINILELIEYLFFGWYEMKEKSVFSAHQFSFVVIGLFFLYGEYFSENEDMGRFWFLTLKTIHSWTNIPVAELTAIICRGLDQTCANFLHGVVKIQRGDKCDGISLCQRFLEYLQSDKYTYICLNEWEQTTTDGVEWNIFIEKIKSLSGLFEMLRKQNSDVCISVRSVVDFGSGYVTELVAKYIIQKEIEPSSLVKILEKFKTEENMDVVEDTEIENEDLKSAHDDIAAVKKYFDISLEADSILSNVCWELGVLWQKNPNETIYLTRLVNYFRKLDYTVTSSGTGILIWQFLLRDRLLNVTDLTNRFKCIPSDRLSIEKIGVSKPALATFFLESRRFLDSILDLMEKRNQLPETRQSLRDSFWQHDDRAGLVDRAKKAGADLSGNMIHLHMDLIYVLDLYNEFNLTDISVHSLFSDEQKRVLFKPLTNLIYNTQFLNVNPTVFEGRIEFLQKILSMGVEELADDFDNNTTKMVPNFYNKVLDLAKIWNCDADIIRRHYILELLSSGFDTTAQNAIRWLNDVGDLPERIFTIGGLRLKYLIDTLPGPELIKLMTSISPLITNWTRGLVPPIHIRNPNASMVQTEKSMNAVFSFLPSTSSHYTPGKYLLMSFKNIFREGFN